MGRLGCTSEGYLDESKFNEPMPWIGIYVAAASAACAMAMAMDTFHGLRYRKFWFPCKFFSLNATTLTLIAVAVKLSVDLNTAMPGSQDQLAKLSSAVFICTAMGNFMPSLGTMENKELMMNIVALGILVITVIVNICIQLGTGVIYVFWKEHALVMLLMLILLAILSSSALAVPSTKVYLEIKYSKKLKLAVKECSENTDVPVDKRMRENLPKYWMMAHTCNPQFVIGRLATCTASGAFCLLSAVILAEAMLRSYFVPRSFKFCHGDSDYKWSTTSILVTQIIAVGVGTIAPAFRWFTAIKFRCPKKAQKASKTEFKVEKYWNRKLVELKECPLALRICGRHSRKLVHNLKNQILDFCIGMQSGIVLVSKLVRFISIFLVGRFLACLRSCSRLKRLFKCNNSFSSNDSGSERQPSPEMDLSRFVVHLQGEEVLVDLMMENNSDPTLHWIRMGEKKKPKQLIQLLEKSNYSQELKGVSEFDSHLVPSLDSEEPPNCWALPVVTLTSIAAALPNIDHHAVKQLIRSVHEGLVYVRVIENNLSDAKGDLINTRKAAEIVWLGVDLYHKWLDVNLHKMGLEGKCPKDILEGLSNVAKNKFVEFKKRDMHGCLSETPSRWPIHALAANSMYRICQTTLQGFESKAGENSEKLFERLSVMISDILSACLTNLKRVIANQCNCSTVEKREERVRYAILLFGETEEILKNLELFAIPDSYPDERAHIDDWRLLSKQKQPLDYYSSSAEDSSTASFSSPSFQISIE